MSVNLRRGDIFLDSFLFFPILVPKPYSFRSGDFSPELATGVDIVAGDRLHGGPHNHAGHDDLRPNFITAIRGRTFDCRVYRLCRC